MTDNVVPLRAPSEDTFREAAKASKHTFKFPFVFDGSEGVGVKVRWTIKNLMIGGGVTAIYGPPKSGKSFLAQDAAYRVAHGMDFFGQKTEQGLVVYICGEGHTGFRQRMQAWRQVNGMEPTENFVMLPAAIDMTSEGAVESLSADLKAISDLKGMPIAMIVIDTLARSFGSGDENNASDMNKFVNGIGYMQDELERFLDLKPHVIVVHHSDKQMKGMRGSNAFLGAVDCSIEVTADTCGVRQARVAEVKDAAPIGPFHYRLKSTHIGTDEDGDDIFSCGLEPATIEIVQDADVETEEAPKKRRRRRAKAS